MNLTRIKLRDIIDERFCLIDENRQFHNRDYRTLMLFKTEDARKRASVFNLLEVRSRTVIDKLRFRFSADSTFRPAISMVQHRFDLLSFGWSDVTKDARWAVFSSKKTGYSPARLAKWLRDHCAGDALILEGSTEARVSFALEDDYFLAKLRFS